MPDYIGQQFGNYRLTRLLGEGGFAQVYLGEHIYLETAAAIKILLRNFSEKSLQDFLTEARTIALSLASREAKRRMLSVAINYMKIAREAEARATAHEADDHSR